MVAASKHLDEVTASHGTSNTTVDLPACEFYGAVTLALATNVTAEVCEMLCLSWATIKVSVWGTAFQSARICDRCATSLPRR